MAPDSNSDSLLDSDRPVRWGILATGGIAHSFATDLALVADAELVAVGSRAQESAGAFTAEYGGTGYGSYEALLADPQVDVVYVATPHGRHVEDVRACFAAGKHVLCEKPLANTVEEAEAMTAAAERARASGVRSMVAFNYRRVPAVAFARQLVADGRIGDVRHVRAVYLQDWIVDPEFPLVWRLQADEAGSGALGDIGAHIVDLTQFVTGQRLWHDPRTRQCGLASLTSLVFTGRDLTQVQYTEPAA